MATREEEIIRRYFEAFIKHDLDGVIACFHPQPVVIDSDGRRHEGIDAVDVTSVRSSATVVAEWRSHSFMALSIVMGPSLRRSEPKCSSSLTSGSRKSAITIGS
jgi:hypothetical protein